MISMRLLQLLLLVLLPVHVYAQGAQLDRTKIITAFDDMICKGTVRVKDCRQSTPYTPKPASSPTKTPTPTGTPFQFRFCPAYSVPLSTLYVGGTPSGDNVKNYGYKDVEAGAVAAHYFCLPLTIPDVKQLIFHARSTSACAKFSYSLLPGAFYGAGGSTRTGPVKYTFDYDISGVSSTKPMPKGFYVLELVIDNADCTETEYTSTYSLWVSLIR